jgi:hypothetical protein
VNRQFFFERNLLALSAFDPGLCSRLSAAETTLNRYRFLESRSGEVIPALIDSAGEAHPLHSLVDPRREGERLISATGKGEGFLVFLGLGGGYALEAALKQAGVFRVLAVDYDINGIAELLCSREYINILGDPRFRLIVDPSGEELEKFILENYQPVLAGGIRVLPLRGRTEFAASRFQAAGERIQEALAKVSADYSVQSYFGSRWFSNIIRNLESAEARNGPFPPIREAAICAAGPSLDGQLPLLAELRGKKEPRPFIIAGDTSLPSLLQAGIEPDAVVSIDCQHISYYHFMAGMPPHMPLFLDLASPPLVASRSSRPLFLSGGHPLALYVSRRWRPIPPVDTSGANVTYACLSLAETLGAEKIAIYGADFSYPLGRTYARGTYIYPYFDKAQNRFSPVESLFSAFLYRSPSLAKVQGPGESWYYETAALRRYRSALESKAAGMEIPVYPAPGRGAPLLIRQSEKRRPSRIPRLFAAGRQRISALAFLREYREGIKSLPLLGENLYSGLEELGGTERAIFTTLLPLAAAIKRRENALSPAETIEAARIYSIREIDRVAGSGERKGAL